MQRRFVHTHAPERILKRGVYVQVPGNACKGRVLAFAFYRDVSLPVIFDVNRRCRGHVVLGKFVPQCFSDEGKILPDAFFVIGNRQLAYLAC